MKVFNYDAGFESFFDTEMTGKTYFEVFVGSGKPQRVYPENDKELKECRANVARSLLNPPIGSYYPEKVR